MNNLGTHDDQPVVGSKIVLRNAGDGLSDAMKIDPQLMRHGETHHVVMEVVVVGGGRFDPLDKDDPDSPFIRTHTLRARSALIVDDATVESILEKHNDKLEELREQERLEKEEAAGIQRLTAVADAHAAGKHRDLVEGCDECENEAALAAAEADEQ